jgi:hypothetical protein
MKSLVFFLVFSIIGFEKAIAYENPHAIKHIRLVFSNALAYDDCVTYTQKRQFHKENGERCLEDAKQMCWWWPVISDRANVRKCWSTIASSFVPNEPRSKVVGMMVIYFTQHGLDCYEEWCNINTKLYWAQYHFEMEEFYAEVIKRGNK